MVIVTGTPFPASVIAVTSRRHPNEKWVAPRGAARREPCADYWIRSETVFVIAFTSV